MTALGASVRHGNVTFSVWAPRCRSLDLVVDGRPVREMRPGNDGFGGPSTKTPLGPFQVLLDEVAG